MTKRAYNRAYYEANREKLIAAQKAYYAANRETIRAKAAERRASNSEIVKAQERAAYQRNREAVLERQRIQRASGLTRLKEHGLTPNRYADLLMEQGNACAICAGPFGRVPYIDHDHSTGAVRGLLCHNCNVALGHFRDNPEHMRRAIRYLDTVPFADMEASQ